MDNSTAITALVRGGQQIRQVFCPDDWDATTMMAAVSSDPRSLRELGLAWLRYRVDSPLDDQPWQPYDGKPPAGNWLVIDLACQRLVSNVDGMIPDDLGGYQKFEGKWNPDIPVVWCNFPPWWQRVTTTSFEGQWPEIPEPLEPVDFRGLLYGRAMADALAVRIVDNAAKETLPDRHICGADLPWDPPPSDEQKQVAMRWHQSTDRLPASHGCAQSNTRCTHGPPAATRTVWNTPEIYASQVGWDFVREIPVSRDESRFVAGTPRDDIVMARRKGAI